jgi:hypothetical protein
MINIISTTKQNDYQFHLHVVFLSCEILVLRLLQAGYSAPVATDCPNWCDFRV